MFGRSYSDDTLLINEIFLATQGEGPNVGRPVVFIRTFGCNMRCSYCDTMYAVEGDDHRVMTVNDIMNAVEHIAHGCKYVCVTGGEPLIQKNIQSLFKALSNKGHEVDVETNGSIDVDPFRISKIQGISIPPKQLIHFTADYKTSASNESDKMNIKYLKNLCSEDSLKFVVGSKDDMVKAINIMNELSSYNHPQYFFSPVFGMITPAEINEFILDNHLWDVRVQVQLHKIMYDPNKRGV